MRGAIPAELVKEAKGGEVHVDMEDHRSYLMEVCCRPNSSERTNCKTTLTRTMEKLLLPGVSLHYNYNRASQMNPPQGGRVREGEGEGKAVPRFWERPWINSTCGCTSCCRCLSGPQAGDLLGRSLFEDCLNVGNIP